MDEVGVGSILDYAVEEDLEKSDAVEMEMDSCSSGTGSRFWFGVAFYLGLGPGVRRTGRVVLGRFSS